MPTMTVMHGSQVYDALHTAFRRMPPDWRTRVKGFLRTQGHGKSSFDWVTARKDAAGKKRLDNALDGLITMLGEEAARGLGGRRCVDFGAGYVPADGVALWLLGASIVVGVDYNSIARPRDVARSVTFADRDRIETRLAALRPDVDWRRRLDAVWKWALEDGRDFPPGYTYLAPVDVVALPDLLPPFDVLVSTSVLEHIAPARLVTLMTVLHARQRAGARQFHRVDLRDHRDFDNDPYGFLDPGAPFDADADADTRGNGMTLHDWENLLDAHPDWGLAIAAFEPGRPLLMPQAAPPVGVVADSLVLSTL